MRPLLLVRPDGNEADAIALAAGGIPTLIDPYLTVVPASDRAPAARLLDDLSVAGRDHWLVLTSPRAMAAWASLVGADVLSQTLAAARSRGMRVAAVGASTASSLDSAVELVGGSGAEGLVAALAEMSAGTALVPASGIARPELTSGLTAAGWNVRTAVVYDTVPVSERPSSSGALSGGNLMGVVLRSPSAVEAVARWATIPRGVRVYAVGPTTSAAARTHGWNVVSLPVVGSDELAGAVGSASADGPLRVVVPRPALDGHPLPPDHPMRTGRTTGSSLITAYRGARRGRRPIWLMRQAGRSLPEYRAIREGKGMLDSCLDPELAAEITLQPVRRHDVDAAIFFSDIVVPVRLAGLGVEIAAGVGPVVDQPVRTADDVRSLPELDPDALRPIREAVGLAVAELGDTPLIGFAGAPFTVASYLIEGGPSRDLPRTKALMRDDPATWHALLGWVARTTTLFLRAQAEAGASALQLFDSWAGRLAPAEYRDLSAPHSAAVLEGVRDLALPRIHFGTGTADLLVTMRDAGADVMGVDAYTPLDDANVRLGGRTPLQGNIDPALLSAPWHELSAHVEDVVRRGRSAPGHVVNLGHGVPPGTDPDLLTRLVAHVHDIPDEEKL
ncbi:MAG TPA: uroporphyrinogen decarboxylase [Propionibacteriaceae bacterium]